MECIFSLISIYIFVIIFCHIDVMLIILYVYAIISQSDDKLIS